MMPCQISRKKQSNYIIFILGIFSGFLAKYVDTIPSNGAVGSLINIIFNFSYTGSNNFDNVFAIVP